MSDTSAASSTPLTPPVPSEPTWAKPAISIFGLAIFTIAFGVAYWAKDAASLAMMMGAAISMANTVVSYYLGSSSGSTKKTEIAARATNAANTP